MGKPRGERLGCAGWLRGWFSSEGWLGSLLASLVAQTVKSLLAIHDSWVRSLVQKDSLEKGMATHSSTLAWRIPKMEEPGRL